MTGDSAQAAEATLRVGFVPGVTLTKWRRIWGERFPRQPLEVSEVAEAEQRRVLVEGAVDLCFIRLPIERTGLHAIPLYEEVPVVVVPKDHPLAAFDDVELAQLADLLAVDPQAHDPFDLVAYGQGVLRVPHSIARSGSRRDLVYRPIIDAEPTTVALAWRIDNATELIEEFIGVVRGRTVNSSRTAQSRAANKAANKSAGSNQVTQANQDQPVAVQKRAKAKSSTGRPSRRRARRP